MVWWRGVESRKEILLLMNDGKRKSRSAPSNFYLFGTQVNALDETTGFGTFLDPGLGSSDRGSDTMHFGIDEGSIGMNTLSVSLQIVETRSKGVVRLNVGLFVSIVTTRPKEKAKTYLQVESTSETSTAHATSVSFLGIVGGLTRNISSATTIEVGERDIGRELRLDVVFGEDGSSIRLVCTIAGSDSGHGNSGRSGDGGGHWDRDHGCRRSGYRDRVY
jgi:hypothetical protein